MSVTIVFNKWSFYWEHWHTAEEAKCCYCSVKKMTYENYTQDHVPILNCVNKLKFSQIKLSRETKLWHKQNCHWSQIMNVFILNSYSIKLKKIIPNKKFFPPLKFLKEWLPSFLPFSNFTHFNFQKFYCATESILPLCRVVATGETSFWL